MAWYDTVHGDGAFSSIEYSRLYNVMMLNLNGQFVRDRYIVARLGRPRSRIGYGDYLLH